MKHACWFVRGMLSLVIIFADVAHAEPPFSAGNFAQTCAAARREHRIVLVEFYIPSYEPCTLLDRNTWTDPDVRDFLARTAVCTKIDFFEDFALTERYKIDDFPTILLLQPDGSEIERLEGYRDPEVFLKEVRQALVGLHSEFNPEEHLHHARVLEQQGRYWESIQEYLRARAQSMWDSTGRYDPEVHMNHARALEQQGRYSEALTEYLWCLDEGDKLAPASCGINLSVLLDASHDLGARYPQAIDALKSRRDDARAALEQGTTDPEVAVVFAAYNENLGASQQTLEVYDALKADLKKVMDEANDH